MVQVGPYSVSLYTSERFRLDGGAMFGSVPKVLWHKLLPADESNRIQLACNLLVLDGGGRRVLVDVGMGRKWSEKEVGIYAVEYLDSRALHEAVPGVTDLVLTHLHFDHAGGISFRDAAGVVQAAFPQAMIYLSKANLEHARHPNLRERASYLAENLEPAIAGKLTLTEDGAEILPQIKTMQSNGHTHGLQILLIGEGKGAIAYPSDLIPTSRHLAVPYVMSYDLCAETSMREKDLFLKRAVAEEWRVVFEHDADTPCATLTFDERGRAVIRERVELPRWKA